MARPPYHIARQEHLGNALDDLAARGVLRWRWEYDAERSRAVFNVALAGEPERALDTRSAEQVVAGLYVDLGVQWLPVPHPGGERQRDEMLARTARLRGE